MIRQRVTDFLHRLRVPGLGRNSALSSLQAMVGALVLFGSYKALILWHGANALGLWSLIGAFTLSIRLLDPSGGASIGRFVAIAQANEARGSTEEHSAATYADSALIVMMLLYLTLCLLAWLPIQWILKTQIDDPTALMDAMIAYPFMMALVPAMVLGMSCADALDGIQRADLRASVMIGGFAILVVMIFALVPRFGLVGFAVAQIVQYLGVAIASRVLLAQRLNGAGLLPISWSFEAAMELLRYGFKLQLASFATAFADPLTKMLLNQYGGLSVLGIYEVSSKIVVQIRAFIVGAAIPLLPVFAIDSDLPIEDRRALISKSNRIVFLASLGMVALAVVGSPILSLVLFGEVSVTLLVFTSVLAGGYFFNTLALPFYLQAQAIGALKWNILGQFSIGALTVSVGPILAPQLGSYAIVIAFALGLSLAGAIFIFKGLTRNHMNITNAWGINGPQRSRRH